MNIRKDILDNSGLTESIRIIKSYNNQVRKNNKIQKENKKIRIANKINAGQKFTLMIIFLEKQENGLFMDEIELEGSKNAINIYELYRSMGHSLKLRTLTMNVEGSSTKKTTFEYKK